MPTAGGGGERRPVDAVVACGCVGGGERRRQGERAAPSGGNVGGALLSWRRVATRVVLRRQWVAVTAAVELPTLPAWAARVSTAAHRRRAVRGQADRSWQGRHGGHACTEWMTCATHPWWAGHAGRSLRGPAVGDAAAAAGGSRRWRCAVAAGWVRRTRRRHWRRAAPLRDGEVAVAIRIGGGWLLPLAESAFLATGCGFGRLCGG